MAYNDNVVFKTSTTATIDDLFTWNKSTGQITAKTDNIPIVPGTVYFTSDGHIVHDLAQNNRLWMSKNAYSAIYAEDVAETNTDIANAIKYSIHYVEGPTTDTTPGTWTGTINGITELYDGLTIIYVPAVAGKSPTTTLNINGLGAKTCYYSNTSAMTTHYSVGTPILLTYRNNCWRRADYNSNTTYSAMSVAEMRTGTATSERSIRADYLKTFLSTLGGTNLTLTHSNSAPYLQLNHDPSGITAGTYGNNSQQNPSYGGTFNIPYFTVDTQGHITNASVTTVKIPESDNTDYKVRQTPINSNDNNNYRILLSNSANDTSEDSVSKKNANLIYNPTENKLSTGNIKLTGELDVTGNVYLRNQTAVDSLTAGSLIVNGNSTFNNDINLAQGAVKWTSNSLPSVTSANYFLVIDAFANGGATKYITKADAIKSLISSSAIGSSTKPVYWTGSAFNAITSYSGAAALTGTPTAPTATAGTSTTQIATTEFVTNAVAQGFIANDAMVFKGLIGSNQPITQLPTSGYNAGWTYRVANAGIFAGEYCEVGDLLIAIKDGPTSGSSVINTDWGKVEHNIDGAVFRGSGASNSSVGSSTQPVYVNSSGIVTAITGAIANDITGNAATASALTTNAGNNEQLIYFSNGIPTVSSWKILADNHPTFLYQYSSTYTTTVKPQNEDWYVKITLNRTWNSNLMNLVITAGYSNRAGVLYLDCDSYNIYWRAYLTNYNGTNIKAIKREWDGQNKKQIVYLRLAPVTGDQDNIPQGKITIYSPISFSIEQIDSNIPTDLISLQYGYNSSTPITTTKDISGNYANLNKLFVLNNEIQIKNQNNNYSHTIKDYNSSLITDNRQHYLPNISGWIVASPTNGTGSSSTPIYIDENGITRAITGTISNNTTGNAATATQTKFLMNRGGSTVTIQDNIWNHNQTPFNHTNAATVWHQRWKQSGLTYTPLGGDATAITDSGDLVYWLSAGNTSNVLFLNMAIDGMIYAGGGFKGDLNGTATNATQLISNDRMDYGWNGINYFNISTSNQSAAKVNDTPFSSNVWTHILRFNHNNANGYYTDLAIPFGQNSIYYKRIAAGSLQNSTTNGGWIKVLDQLNYTSYTVTKTGSGASGTWNINISGNAATATAIAQNATVTNNTNYRILLSGTATNNAETTSLNKASNLIYNPSENKLSTGNIDLTGDLDVTGNVEFHNETSIDSATINSLIVNGNTSFVQSPIAPTPESTDNSTKIATTAFVKNSVAGLSGAMHFKGITTSEIIDGSTTNPITINNSSYTASAGDVILREITTGNIFEYVWTGTNWEMLGRDTSFKVTQTAVFSPNASGATTAFIDTISQDTNGVITVTKKNLDTSGTWSGNAATATTASKLSNTSAIGSSTQPVYFNSSGQPVAVNKYDKQTGKTTDFVPHVKSDGVMEIGKYIDFHNTSEDTSNYIVRITARDSSETDGAGLTLTDTTVGTFKGNLNGTATKATQDGNGNVITSTYLPLSGGTMTGNLQWNDLTALPSTTTTDYFLAIDSFANGGTTKYITKGNALKSLISSFSIGTSLRPVYWTGSSFSQVNWFPSYCMVDGHNKNNYNYHRIATLSIGGSTWVDRDAILVIRSRYSTSNYGIVKISGKANNNQGLLDLSAYWLIRSGFEEDSILICRKRETTDTSLGDTQVDVYLKTPLAYPRICVYMLVGPSHLDGFQLINSKEKDNSVLSYNTSDAENPNVIDINNSDLKGSYEVYIRDKDENGNLLNSFSGYNPNNSNSQTTPTAQSQVYTHIKTALDAGSVSRAKKSSLISTNQNAIAYYTDTTGTFGQKASANGALYATSANGSLQWGTLPMAQGGTGATTAAGARTNLGLGTMATEAANNYIAKSVGTAKGDIIYWSAANTPARLNIGSVGQVLKVSSNGIPVWSNTDILVKQTAKSDNKNYKILFTTSDSPTSGNANEAAYDTDITINPSTHTLTAAKFIGSLQGNADTATTATQDGNGNNIINTYLTKTAGVTNITWDNTNKKLIKTINNSNSDIVTLYAANLKLNNTAVYNTELEIKNIKIGNGSTSTSTKNVKLEYNETLEVLNFVFS